MSMRDLKEIDEIREVVADIGKYPKLALIIIKRRLEEIELKFRNSGICGDTLEEIEELQEKIEHAINK